MYFLANMKDFDSIFQTNERILKDYEIFDYEDIEDEFNEEESD